MKKSKIGMMLTFGLFIGILAFGVYLLQWKAPVPEGTIEKPVAVEAVRPS